MFLFSLFLLTSSVLDDIEKHIPEIVVKIPVSVVFIGQNDMIKKESLSQESLEKWFKNFDFTTYQNKTNSTDQFITSEVSKAPPMKYKFVFSVFELPEQVHMVFEKVLDYTARFSYDKRRRYVHFYVIERLLQSLVEHYKIPNIAFFPLCSREQYYYCEGMENAEKMSAKNSPAFEGDLSLNITLDKDKSWSSQVDELITLAKNGYPNFFSGWNSANTLYLRLNTSDFLREELVSNAYKGGNRCSQNWFTSGRIFWSDMFNIINKAKDKEMNLISEDYEREIAALQETFELCKGPNLNAKQREHCEKVNKYIQKLREEKLKSNPYSSAQMQFLGMLSAIILDGLKEVITPVTPTFETPFSRKTKISITTFSDTNKNFPSLNYTNYMTSYLLYNMSAVYEFENINLNEWPGIGIPITTRVTKCDESVRIRNYDDYRCIDKMLFREELSSLEVPHELRSDANITEREVVTAVIVGSGEPILLSKSSPAFAYDWSTLATFTTQSPDIRPLLRSTLVHLYGLTAGEGWNSATIMSPSSTHYPLGQLSKDVAYRNAMRAFLSKGRAKIVQRLGRIKELLNFADEVGAGTASISKEALVEQIKQYGQSVEEILDLCERFEWLQMRRELFRHRLRQKQLSKQLKEIARQLDENLCSQAPAVILKTPNSWMDWFDNIAIVSFPVWIGTFFFALLSLFIVYSRKIKMA
ncbi:hypothetical protein TVAG_182050 [Trichomonas vaginalis G3]|uniref:Uncharacterized protein n=1 Tax=Trichomonas vaginalis (strain ATCC PRA-98 / G3) TaxID=412133 RepID=A2F6Y7_TRIV3|nr:hypothetical protein TVAGG3_0007270 [Trichomonas vaginalis G3]EAX99348.1 hypothetical protein TVAG_182050 [Trichomonas vaginalis G3]KAI5538964.1 hypothetical protein TVAGG3_0007270 [Trichomonas vaginalis G3]|eukprot:XP_001312278.1 hypothetical protein [Trichomonas vaginalis G3]